MNLQISEALRLTRMLNHKNSKQTAELLQISASYLSEIESGKKEPSLSILQKYSEVFETKVSSIISLSESIEKAEKGKTVNAKITSYALSILYSLIDDNSKKERISKGE